MQLDATRRLKSFKLKRVEVRTSNLEIPSFEDSSEERLLKSVNGAR